MPHQPLLSAVLALALVGCNGGAISHVSDGSTPPGDDAGAAPDAAGTEARYFVATTGNDADPGSSAKPFRTIGHCAKVAIAGDTCEIRGGEYVEPLITPAHSGTDGKPISFISADLATPAIVMGTSRITGWIPWSGSVWKASVTTTFSELFADGKRLILARTPNLTSGDESIPEFYQATADGDQTSLIDATHLTQADDYWNGVKAFLACGLNWIPYQSTVTDFVSSEHRMVFSPAVGGPWTWGCDRSSRYFLFDRLDLLDAPSEWFLDTATQTVYVWMPQGDNPNDHVLDAPSGAISGFDLTDRSHIRISGLTLRSSTILMPNSTNCTIEDSRHLYPVDPLDLGGADNALVHSEVAHARGACVRLWGTRNAVRACEIHHCDSLPPPGLSVYFSPVHLGGPQNVVADSKIHHTGRDGILTDYSLGRSFANSIVEHNEIFETCLTSKDCGGFYTFGADGEGTVLRYNIVHDVWPARSWDWSAWSYKGMGIYLDWNSPHFFIHHNVTYQIANQGIFLNQPSKNNVVANNTAVATGNGDDSAMGTMRQAADPVSSDLEGTAFQNNLGVLLDNRPGYCLALSGYCCGAFGGTATYDHNGYFASPGHYNDAEPDGGVEATGVVGDPLFASSAACDFSLLVGSPMVDRGTVIPGITDGFAGTAPDIGAYELGGSEQPGPREIPGPR